MKGREGEGGRREERRTVTFRNTGIGKEAQTKEAWLTLAFLQEGRSKLEQQRVCAGLNPVDGKGSPTPLPTEKDIIQNGEVVAQE